MTKISASLMCANALDLRKDLLSLEEAGVDLFHIDIMDGHFVPNIAMNLDVLSAIQTVSKIPFDVHLMVDNPGDYVEKLKGLNVEYLSFHIEAEKAPIRLLRKIREMGIKAGVAYNPATSLSGLEYIINELDFVLLMTVEPGFASQSFITSAYEKIEAVRKLSGKVEIQVDGGLAAEPAKECVNRGADILVCGTLSIFKGDKPIKDACDEYRKFIYSPR